MTMEKKITGIEPQKRNEDRVNIFVDDLFCFSLSARLAKKIVIGQSLSDEEFESLTVLDESIRAKSAAANLLKYRPRSKFEVRNHLLRKKFTEEAIDRAVEELSQSNLLNDLEFANFWIEQRDTFKPRGRFALRSELLQKGVDQSIISDVLANIDEHDAALRAGAKRAEQLSGATEQEFTTKLSQYLERRGFEYDVIAEVAKELRESATAKP